MVNRRVVILSVSAMHIRGSHLVKRRRCGEEPRGMALVKLNLVLVYIALVYRSVVVVHESSCMAYRTKASSQPRESLTRAISPAATVISNLIDAPSLSPASYHFLSIPIGIIRASENWLLDGRPLRPPASKARPRLRSI